MIIIIMTTTTIWCAIHTHIRQLLLLCVTGHKIGYAMNVRSYAMRPCVCVWTFWIHHHQLRACTMLYAVCTFRSQLFGDNHFLCDFYRHNDLYGEQQPCTVRERLLTKQQNGKITIIISHYTHEMSRTIVCVKISRIEQWNYSVWLYMGWRCSQLSLSIVCFAVCDQTRPWIVFGRCTLYGVCIWFLHFVSF